MKIIETTTTLRMFIPTSEGRVHIGETIRVAEVGLVYIMQVKHLDAHTAGVDGWECKGELVEESRELSLRDDMRERRILAGVSNEERNWWL